MQVEKLSERCKEGETMTLALDKGTTIPGPGAYPNRLNQCDYCECICEEAYYYFSLVRVDADTAANK